MQKCESGINPDCQPFGSLYKLPDKRLVCANCWKCCTDNKLPACAEVERTEPVH